MGNEMLCGQYIYPIKTYLQLWKKIPFLKRDGVGLVIIVDENLLITERTTLE